MSKVAPNASARIDEAIAKSEPFAQPILNKLREIILSTDKRLVEDWKWGPCFHYKGNVCGIWGHKKHVNLIFWKGVAMDDPDHLFIDGDSPKALRFVQFTDVKQIKVGMIKKYVKAAIKLQEEDVKVKATKVPIVMPAIFIEALNKNKTLKKYFDGLAYSHQKDFAHYIGEAKREATQVKRLEKVMDMLKNKVGLHDQYKKRK
jgi:uncharacterized protein YdeI (YjbR/CyaY-like superfamily)